MIDHAYILQDVLEAMSTRSRLKEYRRLNGKYLAEAQLLLSKGDYAQASEKYWGAAASMIKAVAARRGARLGSHRSLGEFIVKLDREHPSWSLIRDFHAASDLHTNFYEDTLPREIVEDGAEAVEDLVHKLRSLLA